MNSDEVSDPSDWNNTTLPALYSLDSNLRCLICKDYYTAPVITSCLHTFCSLCIRRSLSTDAICPACRTTNISDSGLRQNRVVADLVENFLSVRPRLLQLARSESTQPGKSLEEPLKQDISVLLEPEIDSSDRTNHPIPDLNSTKTGLPDLNISCPICHRKFKTPEHVDLHIDSCTGPQSTSFYNLRPMKPLHPNDPVSNSVGKPPITPLPRLNYAMYNEKQLRGLLKEHGLQLFGNKATLAARHKEYVTLHNANIDRRHPLSRQELLKQMEEWESIKQSSIRQEKRKDFRDEEWSNKCKDEFSELTRLARESTKRQKIEGEDNGAVKVDAVQISILSSQTETVE